MDLNFFDSEGDSMYDLWTSLLSAVCASVNNPHNACNQDRVRKCGGIEILVRKLKLIQSHMNIGTEVKGTAVQLLFTLDACLSDNELSSKRFGELNGISLVISMLNKSCLVVADRVQIVLTLAHAVDAYAANEKFMKLGNGVTVLIQQLANSDDDEFIKIVKYLLQICVSTEDNKKTTNDGYSPLPHTDVIKRLGDMQMLEKINDLDYKLKCLQTKNTKIGNTFCKDDFVKGSVSNSKYDSLFGLDGQIDDLVSVCSSRSSTRTKDSSATARERTLLQQLKKEKSEKEKLEKLNQSLQETMIRNQSERFQQRTKDTSGFCSSSVYSDNHRVNYKCVNNTNADNFDGNNNTVKQNFAFCKPRFISSERPLSPLGDQNEAMPCYINNNGSSHRKSCAENCISYDGHLQSFNNNCIEVNGNRNQRQSYLVASGNDKNCTCVVEDKIISNNRNVGIGSCPEQPLDLTKPCLSNQTMEQTMNECISTSTTGANTCSTKVLTQKLQKINRNAEIQCGTPFVLYTEQQSEIDGLSDTGKYRHDSSAQTDFIDRPNIKTASLVDEDYDRITIQQTLGETSPCSIKQSSNTSKVGSVKGKVKSKPNVVSKSTQNPFSNISNLGSIKGTLISRPTMVSKSMQSSSPNSLKSKISDSCFVKPIARAPKVRVMPNLGPSGCSKMPTKVIRQKLGQSRSITSECDKQLRSDLNKITLNPGKTSHRPINVQQHGMSRSFVKSQNNVRHLDKYIEQSQGNAADKWQVHPVTPGKQKILPARPAFSDCGTRRYSFTTSSAINSPKSIRKRSVDDSGDIDGFRSNSDESDVEITKPNIHSGVLRSSKKKPSKNSACPGCTAPYVGGLELNSRTYNIILETDPNTCKRHRVIRECERKYIQEVKKTKKAKVKKRLIDVKQQSSGRRVSKKTTPYDYTSDSEKEISPISDVNAEINVHSYSLRKPRRQRVPYTSQEEANLLKGVQTIGKHWNQILVTYDFHPSRTNVDLMWKYKRMQNAVNSSVASSYKSVQTRKRKPFSMCEERRLRRGIKKFGYSWKTILKHFTFSEGRTTEDLRNHWRCIHGRQYNV
ncbi:bouquet formation protein 1 [Mactra antiquata]